MCNFYRAMLLGSFLILVSPGLLASSVKSVAVEEVAVNSGLIFEGRVIGARVEKAPGSKAIHTIVTFEVMDLVKGDSGPSTVELSFLGGNMGDISMQVTEMSYPAVGEHGIYFVENPAGRQVHPLYGWDQGHFIVQHDRQLQQAVVKTRRGSLVYGIEKDRPQVIQKLSDGVAQGVQTSPVLIGSSPMTPAEFKAEIRRIVQ